MLYHLLFIVMTIQSTLPRCWVGVVDQINPPWVTVIGEQGERVELSVEQTYQNIKEGDWVLYWSRVNRLEHIDSLYSQGETDEQERVFKSLLIFP